LVVVAATNPKFTADPTVADFENDMEGPFPLRRLFDGHFVATLYVQFVPWTPGQKSFSGRDRPSRFDPHQSRPAPDIGGEFRARAKLFFSRGCFVQSMSRTMRAYNRAGQQVI
jgi:hypothetical protein